MSTIANVFQKHLAGHSREDQLLILARAVHAATLLLVAPLSEGGREPAGDAVLDSLLNVAEILMCRDDERDSFSFLLQ